MKLPSLSYFFLVLALGVPAVACSSTTVTDTGSQSDPDDPEEDAAASVDEPPAPVDQDEPDASEPSAPDAAAPTCPLAKGAYVQTWKPPRDGSGCGTSEIAAFRVCQLQPDGASCQAARAQYPTCAACLFSDAADAEWGLFVADPDAPDTVDGYRYNYGGCVALETNSEQCGTIWQGSVSCPATVCASCSKSEKAQCESDALGGNGACADWRTSTALFCNRMGLIDSCDDFGKAAAKFCGN